MLKSEFSELTGFYPTDVMYMAIENAYMGYNGSKRDFCRDFRDNKDGMAEAIAERADRSHASVMEKAGLLMKETEELKKRFEKETEKLKKQLESEQEWRPYECESNVKESEYQEIARSPGIEKLSVSEARKRVAAECGFAEERILVISETCREEMNRHGQIRSAGKISREPLWGSTDENYIRFYVNGWTYELYNGDLRIAIV